MGNIESMLPELEGDAVDSREIRRRSRHGHVASQLTQTARTTSTTTVDDPWWWEVENENLILDQVPNVTANFHESESVPLSDDFNRLLKIGESVSLTLGGDVGNTDALGSRVGETGKICEKAIKIVDDVVTEAATAVAEETANESGNVLEKTDYSAAVSAAPAREQTLEEFKEELRVKRLARQTAVQDLRDEIATLRRQLATEQALTQNLRRQSSPEIDITTDVPNTDDDQDVVIDAIVKLQTDPQAVVSSAIIPADEIDEDDVDPSSRSRHANIELANAQLALQLANADNISLRSELGVVRKQVGTLKEVIACCKQMLSVKEEQCIQLKSKLTEIETSFGEREMKIMSNNLRQEYERQLNNIRQLRQLYEERQRVAAAEYENLQRLVSIKKDELIAEQEKTKNFEERNQSLLKEVETANSELAAVREECSEHKYEKKALKEEMSAVNTLFSQMVMGFNGKNNLDIDRLTRMLEENRTLLNDMAIKEGNCSDGATLPKLLFELVEQAAYDADTKARRSLTPTPTSLTDADPDDYNGTEDAVGDNDGDTVVDANEVGGAGRTCIGDKTNIAMNDEQNADTVAGDLAATDEDTAADVHNDGAIGVHVVVDGDVGAVASTDSAGVGTPSVQTGTAVDNDRQGIQEGTIGVSISNFTTMDQTPCVSNVTNVRSVNNAANNNNNTNSKANTTIVGGKKYYKKNATTTTTATSRTKQFPSSAVDAAAMLSTTLLSSSAHSTSYEAEVVSAQEIIGNLPKVWKVLMELLSHHSKIEQVKFEENGSGEDCYKSVETASGIKTELSVSKTYIKLKDLIMEKKSLVKETNRLKTLNCHLEHRLNAQEKRLSTVSLELTKTWHLVGKMQRQHRQLHTQEQILRYQLQQKRRLLGELKDELEYCRRKWAAARAKNDESQEQCNDLRREFAKRKLEDANQSAESGYSDSGPQSDEEEQRIICNAADNVETEEASITGVGVVAATAAAAAAAAAAAGGNCRRKHLKEMFEHTRKIKRMQSTSPGRAAAGMDNSAADAGSHEDVVVLRWNSAPPTCGWRQTDYDIDNENDDVDDDVEALRPQQSAASGSSGAVPKCAIRSSRSKNRYGNKTTQNSKDMPIAVELLGAVGIDSDTNTKRDDRACRIQRLEEQCKSLIKQVLETSDNRERLEIQLCRFQDEIAPVQYAVPLDEFINRNRLERMKRASSAPAAGTLTPREEEYTRKRSERLGRLEEESRQLMSRIKRTSDRGHYLRCSLDRIRRAPSREGSFESNTEEELPKNGQEVNKSCSMETDNGADVGLLNGSNANSPLTVDEETYTARRAARLERLEEQSKLLLKKLSSNTQRSATLETKLDNLHDHYKADATITAPQQNSETETSNIASTASSVPLTVEQRIEDIEKVSANREARLSILEQEGKELLTRLTNTSARGTDMINRIQERENNRQLRLGTLTTTSTNTETKPTECVSDPSAIDELNSLSMSEPTEEQPIAAPLLPTLNTVACSSIVGEELNDRVTVTTTASQIAAAQRGAIPKSKPLAQLSAARQRTTSRTTEGVESLEDMVNRLKSIPFPKEVVRECDVGKNEDTSQLINEDRAAFVDETSPDTPSKAV